MVFMAGVHIGTSARVDMQISPVDKLDPRYSALGGKEGASAAVIIDWDAIRREYYAETSGDERYRTGKKTPYPKIYFNTANGMLHLEADTIIAPEWILSIWIRRSDISVWKEGWIVAYGTRLATFERSPWMQPPITACGYPQWEHLFSS